MASKRFVAVGTAIVIAATACISASHAQESDASSTARPSYGLADLDAMAFECPKAALNAAAREAAKVSSQGTYQFAYFNIIQDAHHALFEVHFKSNYQGEPELKYCVSMYCQQGWDPKTSKTEVTLVSTERQRGTATHTAVCDNHSVGGKKKPMAR